MEERKVHLQQEQRQNLKAAICKVPYPPSSNHLMYTFTTEDP